MFLARKSVCDNCSTNWLMKVQNNLQKNDNFWMKFVPTNYKLQITIYETKGRQVKDLPAAHHLQPAEKLLSSLFVREFHDHVPTRATLNQRDEFYTLCMHKMNKFLDKT